MSNPREQRDGRWSHYRALKEQGLKPVAIAALCGVSLRTVRAALKPRVAPPLPPELLGEDGMPCRCYYCGLPACVVDVVRQGMGAAGKLVELRTPACTECRMFAARSRERVLILRKAAVKDRLRQRYGERLNVPDLDAEDLAYVPLRVEGFLRQVMSRRDEIRDRLAW